MQLVYLETATRGLQWFKQYYSERPELNWQAACTTLRATNATLKANPYSGRQFDDLQDVFECKLARTAFSLLYTVKDDTVYVIDLRDQRGWRSAAAVRAHTTELRQKYGLNTSI
jgi:hypothetical protein